MQEKSRRGADPLEENRSKRRPDVRHLLFITISSASNRDSSNDVSLASLAQPPPPKVQPRSPVLPEDIARELEALGNVDDVRKTRIERLEQIRRGNDDCVQPPDVDDRAVEEARLSYHDSAESSVEGKFFLQS